MGTNNKVLISRQEAATMFGVTEQTISNWTERKILDAKKLGDRHYISRASAEKLLEHFSDISETEYHIAEYKKLLDKTRSSLAEQFDKENSKRMLLLNFKRLSDLFRRAFEVLSKDNDFGERAKDITTMYLEGKDFYEIASKHNLSQQRVREIAIRSIRRIGNVEKYQDLKQKNRCLLSEVEVLKLENARLRSVVNEEMLQEKETDKELLKLAPKAIDMLCKPIRDTSLSVRAVNCLKAMDIDFVYELVVKSRAEIMKCRNMGRKSMYEVDSFVERFGLCFNMPPSLIGKVLAKYGKAK